MLQKGYLRVLLNCWTKGRSQEPWETWSPTGANVHLSQYSCFCSNNKCCNMKDSKSKNYFPYKLYVSRKLSSMSVKQTVKAIIPVLAFPWRLKKLLTSNLSLHTRWQRSPFCLFFIKTDRRSLYNLQETQAPQKLSLSTAPAEDNCCALSNAYFHP